jgi:hypothetical protein
MIRGGDLVDVITVRKERKIKRKLRRCGPPGADPLTVVSVPEEVYIVLFHKRRRLDDC